VFTVTVGAVLAAGCDPVVEVTGAFFPAWFVCLAVGVAVSVGFHLVCAQIGLDKHLTPLPLVYASLATIVSVGLWLVLFRR